MASFSTLTHGKWILAGEHSVLRGGSALVFPFFGRSMQLEFWPGGMELACEFSGENGEEMRLLFWGVMERALSLVHRSRTSVTGRFVLNSNVPVGAGLGASATLCAAIGKWLNWQGWVTEDKVYDVARELENLFHGESSGVDIAVALSGEPLEFRRGVKPQVLRPAWQPTLYISYSGVRGLTAECVKKVQHFVAENPTKAKHIDNQMTEAVEKARNALLSAEDARQRLNLLQAVTNANQCFEAWGLISADLAAHMKKLKTAGALATKPTGSGQGGFVLSIWDQPPAHTGIQLEPIYLINPDLNGPQGHVPRTPPPALTF